MTIQQRRLLRNKHQWVQTIHSTILEHLDKQCLRLEKVWVLLQDSSGAKFTNKNKLKDSTTPITTNGNGNYTWSNGAQMTGYFAKQGYGLTSTWTVPITDDDTSFTFSPYAGADDDSTVEVLSTML